MSTLRHRPIALLVLAVLLGWLAPVGGGRGAFAQSPTATPIVLEPRDLMPGALDSLATFVAGATATTTPPAAEQTPTATTSASAPAEATATLSEAASATTVATQAADATEPPTPTATETVATATLVPAATPSPARPTPQAAEATNAPGGTNLLVLGGIGALALAGAVLWRRR